ncbi:MAG: TRAP transporter substrate-binding protein [Clostridiales bacterium]|nr:TRAP transporter substrate-binding protein [Clostridiales bacterium]
MKKRFMAIGMAVILAFSLTACGGSSGSSGGSTSGSAASTDTGSTEAAASGEVYKIKMHHDLSEESAQHQGLLKYKEIVEKKSGGRVQIQIFANNTLGTDTEVAEMLQTGSVESALIPTAKLSGFYAPLQLLDLPFVFPTRDACYGALDDEEFKSMLLDPMEEIGFKGINFWESGFKQFTANSPLESMADFNGLKFRTMESPLIIAQFEALGASPTPIDLGETYNSLQQGVVDGEENPLVTIVSNKFYEVQKNCTISNHAYLAYALLFAKSYWDTLPEDIQQIIEEAAAEAVQEERQITIDNEDGYIQTIKDSGCEVSYLSDEAKAEMTEAMKPVHEQFRDVIGSDTLDKGYEIIESYNK